MFIFFKYYKLFNKNRLIKLEKGIEQLHSQNEISDSEWEIFQTHFVILGFRGKIAYFSIINNIRQLEDLDKGFNDLLDLEITICMLKFIHFTEAKHTGIYIDDSYSPSTIKSLLEHAKERSSKYQPNTTKPQVVSDVIKSTFCYLIACAEAENTVVENFKNDGAFFNDLLKKVYADTRKPDNSKISERLWKYNNKKPSSLTQSNQSSIISESDLQNNFSRFSWRDMEELTGKLFEKKGYTVKVTQASSDFGIDVWATKNSEIIGIQVKHWNNDVGFDDVTKTLGSNLGKATKYILISTKSFFTNQAWTHQKQHSHLIDLWDTNRFRKELRDNFVKITDYSTQNDNIDSFDFDKGFNVDEVYDSSFDEHSKKLETCTSCFSIVTGSFCSNCGKKFDI